MESVTNSRSPPTPKSDKSFWILLVSVIVIVIILIVVLTMCNKPCNCKDKSCKGTCVPDETPCKLDNDCTFFGERCVGPSNQNYTPPGNCMLSKAQCKNDKECLPNMYCADPQKMPNPITSGNQGVCYPKKLCQHEVSQTTDPCIDSNKVPTGWECDVGYVLHSISPTASTGGTGTGTWILTGNAKSVAATGNYSVDVTSKLVTFTFSPSTASPSGKGAGFFHSDIATTNTTNLPKGFTMKATSGTIPTFTTAPVFTLLKPLEGARGYCSPPPPSIGPAQLNSQSHTLRGASHSSY